MDIDMLHLRVTKRAIESWEFATWKQGVMTSPVLASFMKTLLDSMSSDLNGFSWWLACTELWVLAVKREVFLWRCVPATHVHVWKFVLRHSPLSKIKQRHRRRSVRVFSHEVMWQREFVPVISRKRALAAIIFTHAVNQLLISLCRAYVPVCVCVCVTVPVLACSCLCVCVFKYVCICLCQRAITFV